MSVSKEEKKISDYLKKAVDIENLTFSKMNYESADGWASRVVEIAKMLQLEELKET